MIGAANEVPPAPDQQNPQTAVANQSKENYVDLSDVYGTNLPDSFQPRLEDAARHFGLGLAPKIAHIAFGYDRIDAGVGGHVTTVRRGQAGRTQDEPARNAVKLDQRQGGCELMLHGEEDRATQQRRERAAETGAARKRRQRHARIGCPQRAGCRRLAQQIKQRA